MKAAYNIIKVFKSTLILIQILFIGNLYAQTDGVLIDHVDGTSESVATGTLKANGIFKTDRFNETSDERLKRNIITIEKPMELLEALRGVTYYWRAEKHPEMMLEKDLQYGLIAQEVEKVIPELVSTDSLGWKSVDYSHLTPILLEALKGQQETILELQSKLDRAEYRLDVLTVEMSNQKIELMNIISEMQYQAQVLQGEVQGIHELFSATPK